MVVRWCNVVVCGFRNYTVDACSSVPGGLVGDQRREPSAIRVKFAETSFMQDTLLHEITHAVWDACGLIRLLHSKYGHLLTAQQLEDLEEDIMCLQTPGLISTLTQAGWLKLPKPPKKVT